MSTTPTPEVVPLNPLACVSLVSSGVAILSQVDSNLSQTIILIFGFSGYLVSDLMICLCLFQNTERVRKVWLSL